MISEDNFHRAEKSASKASEATIDQLLQDALAHLQINNLQEAEDLYRQILNRQPNHPYALHVLGMMNYQAGHTQRAVELLERAIAAKPDFAEACISLADIFVELGQLDAAVARYRQALETSPTLVVAHYNLGQLLQSQGRLKEAQRHYQQALAVKPDYAEARGRLGEVLRSLAQESAALREGINTTAKTQLQQQTAQGLCDKAALRRAHGQLDEAMDYYQQAIVMKPDFAKAHGNLGNLLMNQGRLAEALVSYQNAIALEPDRFIGYNQAGNVLRMQKRLEEAAALIRQAILLDPGRAPLYVNLALVLREQDNLEAADASCEQALRLQPNFADAIHNLADIRLVQGRVDSAIDLLRRLLKLKPDHIEAASSLLMMLHYLSDYSPADLFAEAKTWVAHHIPEDRCLPAPPNHPDPHRRVRVGYVSSDFNGHPVGHLIESVLTHHDKSRFELFCYYNHGVRDDLTMRIQLSADSWRDIKGKSDEEVAQQIRRDGIDLLIDLSGHTAGNRLMVFALKPAPVQATWFGYFDTTGLSAMDYIIADRFLIPPEEEGNYVERVVRLPDAYDCFTPPDYAPEPSSLPALAVGKVTFGCFNNPAKLSEAVISCWSKLLHASPHAQLYLKYKPFGNPGVQQRYLSLFARHDIAPERIRFAGRSPRHEFLAAYHEVDIALDPFPYNGGVTTIEALLMGVPVVSLRGDRFVSHVGESIMMNLGLEEFVADTEEAYIAKAASLAADLPRLAGLRRQLRAKLLDSPLCDAAAFTRNLDAAYRKMWETWCQTQKKYHD